MPAVVVLGAQWGDEGKGKATDQLGASTDYVVKFNGGNNAGHTVVVGDEKYALHLLPSGILTRGVTPIIGNGVVVDLEVLFHELANLSARGVDVSRLRISANAHVIPSYNRTMDRVVERFLGKRQIGTTGRGIGPTYADKMNRVGIRIQDLFDSSILRQKVEGALLQKNALLVKVYNRREADVEAVTAELLSYADRVRPMLIDCSLELNNALDAGKTVVFEAGQATMLDVDHGTYPFVTSSNTVAANAAAGSGMGPRAIGYVLGIAKAYTTRVGGGPFPTELHDDTGRLIGERGREFGTNTGRARRCGWFDAVLTRQVVKTSGIDGIALTKLDILDGFETIKVCTHYMLDGKPIDRLPASQSAQARIQPVYEEIEGWAGTTGGARSWAGLPAQAIKYVRRIEELIDAPVALLSTSPERDDTILVHNPFQD